MNKILFLTSSPFTKRGGPLNAHYGFVDRLKKAARQNRNALFITAAPDDIDETKQFAEGFRWTAEFSGILFDSYRILDGQNQNCAEELINKSNFLILGGGHVPTQAVFFEKIKLKKLLERFEGVILGISAGSVNATSTVYAQPELKGEATDPNYRRFFSGLGLTDYNIIPHYNITKNTILDGKKLFEEITYPDSMEREFYAICDGSYLYSENGYERIFGEAYRIHGGRIERL